MIPSLLSMDDRFFDGGQINFGQWFDTNTKMCLRGQKNRKKSKAKKLGKLHCSKPKIHVGLFMW